MERATFPLRFKLFGSSLIILGMVGVLVGGSIVGILGVQNRASDLYNVYGRSLQIVSKASTALYKLNLRGYHLIAGGGNSRVTVDLLMVRFDFTESLDILTKVEAEFSSAMPEPLQNETIRPQWKAFVSRLQTWLTAMRSLPELTSDNQKFAEIFLDSGNVALFTSILLSMEVVQAELQRESQRAYDDITAGNQGSMFLFFGLGVLALGLVIAIILIQNRMIVKPIQRVGMLLNDIAEGEGDLTVKLETANKDEIGQICQDFNVFTAKLAQTIQSIARSMETTGSLADPLSTNSAEVSSSLTEISSNNQHIHEEIARLHGLLSQADGAIKNQTGALVVLSRQITDQGNMVQESTAAITEMMSGIDTVVGISELRKSAADQLVIAAQDGGNRLEAAAQAVGRINDSVTSILDMTKIIATIAAQTSLLAMNAAIEAAHAGEAGAGFSVVADEIRMLSTNASQQSKDISVALKGIVKEIQAAWAFSNQTKQAFTAITGGIEEVSRSFDEITSNNRELQLSGQQILEVMVALEGASSIVRQSMEDISSSNSRINETMGLVQRVSDEVTTGMQEIAEGTQEIARSTQGLSEINQELWEGVQSVRVELGRFKTAPEQVVAEEAALG